MIYITFHTKQNYFLFYDNKIYHLLNLENNNIETIKSSISNTSQRKKSQNSIRLLSQCHVLLHPTKHEKEKRHAIQPKLQIASALFDFTG